MFSKCHKDTWRIFITENFVFSGSISNLKQESKTLPKCYGGKLSILESLEKILSQIFKGSLRGLTYLLLVCFINVRTCGVQQRVNGYKSNTLSLFLGTQNIWKQPYRCHQRSVSRPTENMGAVPAGLNQKYNIYELQLSSWTYSLREGTGKILKSALRRDTTSSISQNDKQMHSVQADML